MRLVVLLVQALVWGCGHVTPLDTLRQDAAADSNTMTDSSMPSRTPMLSRNFYLDCGAVQECRIVTPGVGTGQLVLAIFTYDSQWVHAESVIDDRNEAFHRAIEPVKWSNGDGDLQTEVWWGKRSHEASTITVRYTAVAPGSNIYVTEFDASSIDQVTVATGRRNGGGGFSSETQTTQWPNELLFGHGEAEDALVSAGKGFTLQSAENGNVEETKSANVPGTYEASFATDRAAHWIAIMTTLR